MSAPLAKIDEIVIIGSGPTDGAAAEITKLVGQLPPAVSALTGVDISKVLSKIPGARLNHSSPPPMAAAKS